jgi:ankyrin repeat protein
MLITTCLKVMFKLGNVIVQTSPDFLAKLTSMTFLATVKHNEAGLGLQTFIHFCHSSESALHILTKFGTLNKTRAKQKLKERVQTECQYHTANQEEVGGLLAKVRKEEKAVTSNVNFVFSQGSKMTKSAVLSTKKIFDCLDYDRSGDIALEELEESFCTNRAIAGKSSPIFNKIDQNANGKVTFYELLRILFPHENKETTRYMDRMVANVRWKVEDLKKLQNIFVEKTVVNHVDLKINVQNEVIAMTVDLDETVGQLKNRIEAAFPSEYPSVIWNEKKEEFIRTKETLRSLNVSASSILSYEVKTMNHAKLKNVLDSQTIEIVNVDDAETMRAMLDQEYENTLNSIVDAVDKYGKTLLHHAAAKGSLGCIRALLEKKASIEAQTLKEDTPLHLACRAQKRKAISVLLRAGASPVAENSNDDIPFLLVKNKALQKTLFQTKCSPHDAKILQAAMPVSGASSCAKIIKNFVNRKRQVENRASVSEIVRCMEQDPKLEKYTHHLSITELKKLNTKLSFWEFVTGAYNETHTYEDMMSVLKVYARNKLLLKPYLKELWQLFDYPNVINTNYRNVRMFLKSHQLREDDINDVIEWYEEKRYDFKDELEFREEYKNYWVGLPAKLLSFYGYNPKKKKRLSRGA